MLDLLDSERVLLEVQLGLAQLQSDYMKSLAEMERAAGTAVPSPPSTTGAENRAGESPTLPSLPGLGRSVSRFAEREARP